MNKRLMSVFIPLLVTAACNTHPIEEGCTTDECKPIDCGLGSALMLPSEQEICIFHTTEIRMSALPQGIVIETGFLCPPEAAFRYDFQNFVGCDPRTILPAIDLDFLNYQDIIESATSPWMNNEVPSILPQTNELDILWVIDNSGSMCQEQKMLRDSFNLFIDELAAENVDFHIGITTTDLEASYDIEPVAQPGRLQSTPQPVPGFDTSCWSDVDNAGNAVPGTFAPIHDTLTNAVACMTTPDTSLLNPSDAELKCALSGEPAGCEISRLGCGGANPPCTAEHLFPDPSAYRTIPKVLTAAAYIDDQGVLDKAKLKADFACASMVGTRGYGVEMGLMAAVQAVSPDLSAAGKPNEGFLRRNSRFALFFVSDENDCSHDGTLDLTCGVNTCEYANHPALTNSPLIPVEGLRDELIQNLIASKGRTLDAREVSVASFHGGDNRYSGPIVTQEMCQDDELLPDVAPECASTLGIAFSGERYERFLRSFPHGNQFPYVENQSVMMTGWLCNGNFVPAMQGVGQFLADAVSN